MFHRRTKHTEIVFYDEWEEKCAAQIHKNYIALIQQPIKCALPNTFMSPLI